MQRIIALLLLIFVSGIVAYDLFDGDYERDHHDYLVLGLVLCGSLFIGDQPLFRPRVVLGIGLIGLSSLAFTSWPVIQSVVLDVAISVLLFACLYGVACRPKIDTDSAPKPEFSRRLTYASNYWAKSYSDGTMDKETEVVAAFIAQHAEGNVLDFGCGSSFPAWWLAMRKADSLDALDITPESFEVARVLLENPYLWVGRFGAYWKAVGQNLADGWKDAAVEHLGRINRFIVIRDDLSMPKLERTYDTVTCIYSLGSQRSEESLRRSVRLALSALKPGGKFLYVNTDGENPNPDLPAYTWNGVKNCRETVIEEIMQAGLRVNISEQYAVEGDPGTYGHSCYYVLAAVVPEHPPTHITVLGLAECRP
jgi:SAM-dependent methyltransferase